MSPLSPSPADEAAQAAHRAARQAEVAARLRAVLPAHALLSRRAELTPYECDGLTAYRERPLLVALPETDDQVAAVLRTCHALGVPVVARGAGTSLYYLWVVNAWFLYASLLLTSMVSWDVLITRYNLHQARHDTIDCSFLLQEVSDKNLPLLLNEHVLLQRRSDLDPHWVDRKLKAKIKRFEQRQAKLDWRGWNWADVKTARVL